ncbi:MAG TPA: hypothetical protein VF598_11685 [Hymenobacter sp.]|jgi:hypothetical protein
MGAVTGAEFMQTYQGVRTFTPSHRVLLYITGLAYAAALVGYRVLA